ncbi:MAG: N-acetylmuramoyl-L-alanine amidase [Proteobacteria bacterium]|nr:N-acetylmuramoyl-L-alanine amidase [Pseudomonadota bacterium]
MRTSTRTHIRSGVLTALCLLPGMLLISSGVSANQLVGVRMHEGPDHTRVVLDTTDSVKYEFFVLESPYRIVIDLKGTRPADTFSPGLVAAGRDRVRDLRGAVREGDYRLVLDLGAKVEPKAFTLAPVAPYGHRLVFDLYSEIKTKEPVALATQPEGERDVIIAIDAGHGGEDPGAVGVGNLLEKNIVLAIAKNIAERLNETEGYRVKMIRTGDYYVSLRGRINIARKARADLFVSIHADAFRTPAVTGASVYTISERGASSEAARWLAESENRSDLIGGVGDVSLDDKDDMLAHVLLDLSMDASRSTSIAAGESILYRMGKVVKIRKRQVEQAGFVVLKSPDVPSVLVETGYLSNPIEAERLGTASHQDKVARAIYRGIRDHMESTPPAGTLLARQSKGSRTHTIERGDTLTAIAERYSTTSDRIRRANSLTGDTIRIGQKIVIPAS